MFDHGIEQVLFIKWLTMRGKKNLKKKKKKKKPTNAKTVNCESINNKVNKSKLITKNCSLSNHLFTSV